MNSPHLGVGLIADRALATLSDGFVESAKQYRTSDPDLAKRCHTAASMVEIALNGLKPGLQLSTSQAKQLADIFAASASVAPSEYYRLKLHAVPIIDWINCGGTVSGKPHVSEALSAQQELIKLRDVFETGSHTIVLAYPDHQNREGIAKSLVEIASDGITPGLVLTSSQVGLFEGIFRAAAENGPGEVWRRPYYVGFITQFINNCGWQSR